MRILVIEGNNRAACGRLTGVGAINGADLYVDIIGKYFPEAKTTIARPTEADYSLPPGAALKDWDGVIMGGSGLRVNDDDPQVRRQIDLARAVMAAGVPFFGSCWGLQVAVVAAGGMIAACPKGREVGFARKIVPNDAGRAHFLYQNKTRPFDALAIHFDEVSHVPSGGVVLASNGHSRVQALTFPWPGGRYGGRFTGVQYHPEYDLFQMARLVDLFGDVMTAQGCFASPMDATTYAARLDKLHRDPYQQDEAWLLGIDESILDDDIRYREITNWITNEVIAQMAVRR